MRKRPLIFIVSMMFALALFCEEAETLVGTFLLPGAQKIAPNRFQSPKGFEETVKEIKKRIGAKHLKPTIDSINLPHVRSVTLQTTDSAHGITSINIYLNIKTGITEFFLLGPSPAR